MDELIAFLRARLDEDERVARGGDGRSPDMTLRLDDDLRWVSVTPARVLCEVEAKRLLLRLHRECDSTCYVVRVLALPYVDHRDYREEWRP